MLRCLVLVLSARLLSAECHYDFRLGRTECTHHDGSKWSSGQMVDSSPATPASGGEKRSPRAIDRSAVALSMAAKTKQGLLDKKKTKDKSSSSSSSSTTTGPVDYTQLGRGIGAEKEPKGGKGNGGAGRGKDISSGRDGFTGEGSGSPWVVSCFERSCGRPWVDSRGRRIEAHGGGMLQVANGTYFWYGESEKLVEKVRGYGYSMGVNCYSAINLGGPWRHEGLVLGQQSIWAQELGDKDRPFVIERPKVLFNAATSKYVMWFHLDAAEESSGGGGDGGGGWRARRLGREESRGKTGDAPSDAEAVEVGWFNTTDGADGADGDENLRRRALRDGKHHRYWFRRAGVAMADSPVGPFRFVHAIEPDGLPSLDLQLFEETDKKTAFLVRSVNNEYVGMSRLSGDYLNTVGGIISKVRPCLEGMAVFRHPGDDTLYAVMSHLTGWEPNPLVLLRAHKALPGGGAGERCKGPDCGLDTHPGGLQWVALGNPTRHPKSYNAQPTFVMTLKDKHSKPYVMLMSDNWLYAGPRGLKDAGYIWLPLEFMGAEGLRITKMKNWTMDSPFQPRGVAATMM